MNLWLIIGTIKLFSQDASSVYSDWVEINLFQAQKYSHLLTESHALRVKRNSCYGMKHDAEYSFTLCVIREKGLHFGWVKGFTLAG